MKIVFLHGLGQRAADWDQVASQFPNTDCPTLCCPSCRTRAEHRCPGHRGGDSAGILPVITCMKTKQRKIKEKYLIFSLRYHILPVR